MKILAAGGGSGGHVTPVAAVLREIKSSHPKAEIHFWCDKKFASQAKSVISHLDESIPVSVIQSGKLRRYNSLSLWQQLTNVRGVVLPNIRDMAYVGIGFVQSMIKMIIWRPDVVFTKGGYVCLPIGIAAKVLGIPLVIHDSDAHPGLTNRVLAKWAVAIGTGAPLKFYPYPVSKAKYVGVPIVADFSPFDASKQAEAKQRLGFSPSRPLVVVTGGGLGAQRLNEAIALNLHTLLAYTNVILISGEGQYDDMRALTPQDDDRYQLHAFVSKGMAEMLGAATVVVTRAGATTILELAALAKPTILVPNAYLTGGHQLKNAAVYEESGAVLVVNETDIERDPGVLEQAIKRVITDEALQSTMSKAFESFAKPHSAKEMAELITGAIKRS